MRKTQKAIALPALALTCLLPISFASASDFTLTLLHMNDHHSHLEPDTRMSLKLDGEKTRVQSGGLPKLATLFKQFSANNDAVLKLHAGDAITGDLYYTLFRGQADAAAMNSICFDAFALGNHEFDDGDAGLQHFLKFLRAGGCETSVLAANIKPEIGVSPLTPKTATDYFQPFVVKEVAGHQVGIVGIDIARKTKQSSSPDETTQFLDEIESAQSAIDALEKQGVNKIVLLTHYGYENELKMAEQLTGVDVIIGGDSHSLLGDFESIGLQSEGPYPTVSHTPNNNLVCIAQAWQYAQIMGELNVTFDENGVVKSCSGLPHMPLADSFKRRGADEKRVELEGDERAKAIALVNAHPSLHIVEDDPDTARILEGFKARVEKLKTNTIGRTKSTLCLERIPGQGKSTLCETQETAAHGSDISTLVVHAFRNMAKGSEIAIQNGGGVRTDLPQGDISVGDAYKLLPFANTLVEMQITGHEIKSVLEDALDFAISEGGSTGAYPYAAGLRWHIDASNPKGERVTDIEFKAPTDNEWQKLDANRTYILVTNNYIAAGRDGYESFKAVANDGRMNDTYLDYAQSFVDYVKEAGEIEKLPHSEYSTQRFKQ